MNARVVHLGKYYHPDAGGIERVTRIMALGAHKAGYRVSVVCFDQVGAGGEEVVEDVQVFRWPIRKMIASQPFGLAYFLGCLREARSAALVHLHTPNMLAALCALFIGRKQQLLVHWHSDVVGKGWLGTLSRPLESALLRRADAIIGTSAAYVQSSRLLRPYADKVQVIPFGVKDVVKREGAKALQSPVLDRQLAGKRIVLAIGRQVLYKGFEVLIRAAGMLPDDVAVVIVGDGPLIDEHRSLVRSMGLADKVLLAGRLSDDVVHGLLRRAALFCLPSVSRAEAFGVVLLEAMACGVPVVATRIAGSGVPWVNQDGVTGFNVAVGDPDALAGACNRILESEELRATFARAARQRFLTEFTEEVFVGRVMKVYLQLHSE